ncbi:MAG: sugar transferase [Saprospiraceae bacterium]
MMYFILKRIMDVVFATIALIVLSPIFLMIIIVLFASGEKEVFYKQKRVGYKNQHFNMIKFTTMFKNSMNIGTGSITLRNDPRVTTVGKYLRLTKLNELPQLFNVIKGDMSLVGPRPLVDKTFEAYSEEIQNIVTKMKPGITGIGSIVFRDEEKLLSIQKGDPFTYYQDIVAPIKGGMEKWYYAKRSIPVDLKLIFLTGMSILKPNSDLYMYFFGDLPMMEELKKVKHK